MINRDEPSKHGAVYPDRFRLLLTARPDQTMKSLSHFFIRPSFIGLLIILYSRLKLPSTIE